MKKVLLAIVAIILVIPMATLGEQMDDPAGVVGAFHQTLASGDKDKVLELLSPDVIVFEDSYEEPSRKAYDSGHLDADIGFSRDSKRKILEQTVKISGDAAWVLTRYSVKGKAGGKKIKLESAETVVLEKMSDGWQIVHVHWSNKIL